MTIIEAPHEPQLWDEFHRDLFDPTIYRCYLDSLIGDGRVWKLGRVASTLASELPADSSPNTASGILVIRPEDGGQIYPAMSKGPEVTENEFVAGFHCFASDNLKNRLGKEVIVPPNNFVRLFSIQCLQKIRGLEQVVPTLLVDFDNEPTYSVTMHKSVTDAVTEASARTPGTRWIYQRPQDNLLVTVVTEGKSEFVDTSVAV